MRSLFDAHCDTANAIYKSGEALRQNTCHTDLARGEAYSPRGQVYALWEDKEGLSQAEFESSFWAIFENLLAELNKNRDLVSLCTSYADISAAFAEKKQASLISIEGAELFGCAIPALKKAYSMGARIIHLCWNSDNELCGAAADSGGGLTELGRLFVRCCGELGMIIDLSHASDETARDVLGLNCVHVMASHSDSRAVCDVPRNLPDELLFKIARSGGVVGLNLHPPFLGGKDLELAAIHTKRLLYMCTQENVCLGCDLDGVTELPDGIHGIENMPVLFDALVAGGISHETVNNIFFNNLMSFWERAL